MSKFMVRALDGSERKPVRRVEAQTVEAQRVPPPPPPRTQPGVRERSAGAIPDPKRTAGLSGLRGDLALRGNQIAQRVQSPPKSEDRGALGWLQDKGNALLEGAKDKGNDLVRAGGDLVEGAQQQGEALLDRGGQLVDGAKKEARGWLDSATDLVGDARQKVENGIDHVTGAVSSIGDAFDIGENIDKLGNGDKYKVGVGADVSVEGIKGYTKGTIEIARGTDGKYTVSAEGELGGGLYAQIGGKVGGNASAEAQALVGAGAKVEMKFDTAEEAKRASDALLRTASPPYALLNGGPPSGDDLRFLKDHASAVELKGNAAAKVAAELGVGVRDLVGASAFAGGEVKNEVTLRVDLPQGDKPASVSVKSELSGKLEAGIQAGLDVTKGQPGKNKGGNVGWALQGEVSGKVATEGKIDIPSLDRDALLSDPLGTLSRGASGAFRSAKMSTSITLEGQGTAGKNGGGMEAKLAFEQSPHALANSGAIMHALRGNFGTAIDAAGKTVPVNASITRFTEHGIAAKPEIRVMGFGGGVSAEGIRRDYAERPDWSYAGNATDARRSLVGWLESQVVTYAGLPRPGLTG